LYKNVARVIMSRSKVKDQGHKGQRQKTAESSQLTMHRRACAVARPYTQQAATDDTIAWPPRVTGYAGGKISACCLVLTEIGSYHGKHSAYYFAYRKYYRPKRYSALCQQYRVYQTPPNIRYVRQQRWNPNDGCFITQDADTADR